MGTRRSNVLVTGGCGFMGSHFLRKLYHEYPEYNLVNFDALTYAGNPDNLLDIEDAEKLASNNNRRYRFIRGDVSNREVLEKLFSDFSFKYVFHFAAETHVDRSFFNFGQFIQTNVVGGFNVIELSHKFGVDKLIFISTDEVYGSVEDGYSREEDALQPSSPYSASKASADMLATTHMKVNNSSIVVVRSGNNYGTHQYPEKLIPLVVTNLLEQKKIPVHGNGQHVRSWVHVHDFCDAVDFLAHEGPRSGVFNIAGEHWTNMDIIKIIADGVGVPHDDHIVLVGDRPNADLRYAPEDAKLRSLGYNPKRSMKQDIASIIDWYTTNQEWWQKIKNRDEYVDHYEKQSKARWY